MGSWGKHVQFCLKLIKYLDKGMLYRKISQFSVVLFKKIWLGDPRELVVKKFWIKGMFGLKSFLLNNDSGRVNLRGEGRGCNNPLEKYMVGIVLGVC